MAHLLTFSAFHALDVIKAMERTGKRIVPGAFKVLEPFRVPEDYDTLMRRLKAEAENDKINPDKLKRFATEIIRKRWYTWLLTHPDLKDEHVHSSRRMSPRPRV